ncbi:ferredoxin [Stackebrandtia nassauensis]|uniref:Ferredoxin n=1 Tax=Stackebrandtia nassauensis (strain DSM 44728 / CIP 108903 / NRRL B-16338 / NBRC 102104 / LLR-40K-21) TaxID=446470 RepID=D3PX76_STANL|nr:ferredoxin [Stackebrandtia nassauensis]ADD41339.1 protein of unknown function DUF1271 [Stackebrandtia nassauensis DSM 44728]
MRISVDTERCVAAGTCVLAAAEVFDQRDEDGIVVLLDESPPERLRAEVEDAVTVCPAAAITLREEE